VSRSQGKTHAANDLLASVYNRFADDADVDDPRELNAKSEALK
jgi:hypothetical protein